MATLDLKIEGLTGTADTAALQPTVSNADEYSRPYTIAGQTEFSRDKVFTILRNFLQPNSLTSLKSAAQSILDLLPQNAQLSSEVGFFGELCIDLAEQVPYNHPSQLKFARLLQYLSRSPKLCQKEPSIDGEEFYATFQRLAESIVDSYSEPDPEDPRAFVNFNAFLANLYEVLLPMTPTHALWAMRQALESSNDVAITRDSWTLAAAQWIVWSGQSLFKQVLYLGLDGTQADLKIATCRPGPLYNGDSTSTLSLQRWRFWKEGFRSVALLDGASEECKTVAAKAADMMDTIEDNMDYSGL